MSIRQGRIGAEMQKSITVIINSKLKDPRISGMISISEVLCAKDLKTAKVYINVMGSDKMEVLEGLNSSKAVIRRHLAADLKDLRTVPELTFFLDESLNQGNKIDAILDELNK